MSPALYLIDISGVFRILQDKLRQAWSDHLAAGVIATCPVVELEFLYSARPLGRPVDLLIAATAERERLTLLCDDRDFTAIAQVTGQPVKLVTDA